MGRGRELGTRRASFERGAALRAIAFLAIVVVVSAIGGVVLYVQHHQPSTLESGLDAFRREMDALAPPPDDPAPKLRMAKRPTPRSSHPPAGEGS